ncbi:glycosyltransferase [Almyronema epifaneia]|uniref:Glycosyltransferase n=1 Tax=Almyronema epifaneia S1 TaxID=2991925 RepID=A0ABW6I9W6_9CYAN
MKVAFIVGEFPVLSETFIINQITGLLDRGYSVDIYADCPGDWSKLHGDVIAYNLRSRTHYLPEVPSNLFWRAIKGGGLLAKRLMQAPGETLRSLNFVKYGEPALSLWLLYTLIPHFAQRYDIIHCQFGTVSFRGMAFQTINAPTAKLLTMFRGQDISRFIQLKGPHIYDRLFQVGDYFLANCKFFQQRAIELGCPPDKIRVHGSGLDCSRFPFQARNLPSNGSVRVATVGRLVDKKGIEYAIRAIAKCRQTYPKLEYWIIGEGPLRSSFEQLIESLNLSENVKLLGKKSQEELIALLQQTHLFVAPSVTASDGDQDAPVNVLKEAMAMGLPVISTFHGGIPELVEDGISGFLVPERDAAAIAAKLRYLIDHPERWPAMGQAGRAFVEKHYDLSDLNDRLAELYQQLAASVPRSPATVLLPTS